MLRRTLCGGLAAVGLAALVLSSAGAATTRPKLVFETELTWTRTVGFVAELKDIGLECRVDARLVARTAFYTARSRAPRNRVIRFGAAPNARAMLTGVGYREGSLRVPGTATLEIEATRCSDGRVDRRCAGVFRAALEVNQIFISREAGARGVTSLNWAHRAPNPPTPMPPQVCLSGGDPVAYASGGTMTLFVTPGFTGNHGTHQHVPFPRDVLLSRRAVSTRAENDDSIRPPFEMRDFRATSLTTARFERVR